MELHNHQIKAIKESSNMWGLWFRMRVGKTPTAIRLATSRAKNALIICPKSLTEQWKKEIKSWVDKDNYEFLVISKETFRRDWKILKRYDAVIIDECHRGFANFKTKLFKAGDSYLRKYNIKFLWLLSGTPFTSTSWSVYSYGKLMGRDWNWYEWKNIFFYDVMMGRRMIPMPRKGMETRLQNILRSIGTVVDLKDVTDVMEDEDIFEYFNLKKEQKDIINNLDDVMPITRYTHIHELESGVMKSDGYKEKISIDCEKDQRIIELAEENDKIIIVARYLDQIDRYAKLLANKNLFIIRGGTKETASEIAVRAENSDKAVLLIQSDTCDGYALKSFDITVFASLSYSFVNYDQIRFRTKAMEKKTPNTYIHLIIRDKTIPNFRKSMDQAVYDSVANKQDFSIGLFNK